MSATGGFWPGEAPQATIAKRCIRLASAQLWEGDTEIAERDLEDLQQSHIVQRVGEETADHEFEREIIDAFAAAIVALLFRGEPAMHDAVAQGQRRGMIPILPGRHPRVLADRKPELGKNGALDLRQRQFIDRLARRLKIRWQRWVWQTFDPGAD